jgi:hypothetical protein
MPSMPMPEYKCDHCQFENYCKCRNEYARRFLAAWSDDREYVCPVFERVERPFFRGLEGCYA